MRLYFTIADDPLSTGLDEEKGEYVGPGLMCRVVHVGC